METDKVEIIDHLKTNSMNYDNIKHHRGLKTANTFYCLVFMAACFLVACENDDYLYQGTDAIWLSGDTQQNATTDSVLFSFKANGSMTETTLNLIVTLTGKVSDKDRTFKLEVINEETNVSSSDYEIGSTIMPAGKRTVIVPIKVKRTVSGLDLTKQAAKLTLSAGSTDDLIAGVTERNKYSLLWCDYLTKPDWWTRSIDYYIGPFSQARYQFIIDFANLTSVYPDDYSWVMGFQSKLINLLNEYNSNPANAGRPEGWPYKNDNGQPLQIGYRVP